MENFGKIKNTYNNILSESMLTKNQANKKLFGFYVKKLKQDKVLKEQFMLYNNIENKCEADKTKAYIFVTECINLFNNKFSLPDITKANKLISENVNLIDDYDNKKLHESINYLITNKKTQSNIDLVVEAYNTIIEFIVNNKPLETIENEFDGIPNSLLSSVLVDKYNDKYENLDENSKLVLKTFIDGNDDTKKQLYENFINESITTIDEVFNQSTIEEKDFLLKAKNKLINEKLNLSIDDDFINKISKILELNENLKIKNI